MKWQGRRQSSNVDDQRGQSSSGKGIGGFNPMLLGPLIKILFSKTGLIIIGLFLVFSFVTGNKGLKKRMKRPNLVLRYWQVQKMYGILF